MGGHEDHAMRLMGPPGRALATAGRSPPAQVMMTGLGAAMGERTALLAAGGRGATAPEGATPDPFQRRQMSKITHPTNNAEEMK